MGERTCRFTLRSVTVNLAGRRWKGGKTNVLLRRSSLSSASRSLLPSTARNRLQRLGGDPLTHFSHASRSTSLPNPPPAFSTRSSSSPSLPFDILPSSHSSSFRRSFSISSPSSATAGIGENSAGPPSSSNTRSRSGRINGSAFRAKRR